MDREIIRMLAHVKETTGKEIRVYLDGQDNFYSTLENDTPSIFAGKVKETVSCEENGKTYFTFKHNAQRYTGYIDGASLADKTIASLIGALLENSAGKEIAGGKGDSLATAIVGDCSGIRLQKVISEFSIPEYPCTATVLHVASGRVEDVVNFMENFKTDAQDLCVATDNFTCVYVRFGSSQEESEYRSLTDFADFLSHSIADELGIHVKIGIGGTVASFVDCSVSYHQALTAIRMDNVFGGKSRVSTYKEYVFVKMLEDMPKHKLQEFLDILEDQEAKSMFADAEMIATAEEFLHTSLNVSETSRNLYMHRNTLMYRLDKIERATGLDIRKFQDAMTFRLIIILHKLLG